MAFSGVATAAPRAPTWPHERQGKRSHSRRVQSAHQLRQALRGGAGVLPFALLGAGDDDVQRCARPPGPRRVSCAWAGDGGCSCRMAARCWRWQDAEPGEGTKDGQRGGVPVRERPGAAGLAAEAAAVRRAQVGRPGILLLLHAEQRGRRRRRMALRGGPRASAAFLLEPVSRRARACVAAACREGRKCSVPPPRLSSFSWGEETASPACVREGATPLRAQSLLGSRAARMRTFALFSSDCAAAARRGPPLPPPPRTPLAHAESKAEAPPARSTSAPPRNQRRRLAGGPLPPRAPPPPPPPPPPPAPPLRLAPLRRSVSLSSSNSLLLSAL